jgi:hypothetical protein
MPVPDELNKAFQHGQLKLKGQFMLGSNYTFLVEVQHGDKAYPGVYKPTRGEQPLWDFPENSLAGREVAAYLVSEALGFHLVPFTVLRDDGPYGGGSLQQYIDYDPEYHYFSFSEEDKQLLRPVVVFDLLCNNADRKGSHVLFETGSHGLYAIDHGICFHEEEKLRTVLWDFAGEAIPDNLVSGLNVNDALLAALAPYLSEAEAAALRARARKLQATKLFPRPKAGRRAYPYPPI